jgi:hypothetical protein
LFVVGRHVAHEVLGALFFNGAANIDRKTATTIDALTLGLSYAVTLELGLSFDEKTLAAKKNEMA